MKTIYLIIALSLCRITFAQDLDEKLSVAINSLLADEQFKHSIISMLVVDAATGKKIFDKNSEVGLAPASCQKIITSASAFEILGSDYRYKTGIGYLGDKKNGIAGLYFIGRGDPSLGSFRYSSTRDTVFMQRLKTALGVAGISSFNGETVFIDSSNILQTIPGGWVWEDIGNYYGAGCAAINWRENQYDIILSPGAREDDPATIKSISPAYTKLTFNNLCKTGPLKSGDNAYIYFGLNKSDNAIHGTIPLGENNFSISGAVPDPQRFFYNALYDFLNKSGLTGIPNGIPVAEKSKQTYLYTYTSPTLDSLNYWFLKKSINLYGEAFVKTIAAEKTKTGSTDAGITFIRDFWSKKGVEKSSLKMIDGSGLSPANRLTTTALVKVLQYAKKQSWFSSFYNALPEMNGIKMKDGYIGGVRSYAGYLRSVTGYEYSFAFIVNNFDGNAGTAREKMWKVLDLLK